MLTTGVDTLVDGTAKNDLFNSNDFVSQISGTAITTLNNFDTLDGKGGKDTLNISTDIVTSLPDLNLTSIETVNVKSSAATLTLDGSAWDGTNTLNVTQANTADLTAAATTDVNVSGVIGTVAVNGGKNVKVIVADTGTDTTIGAATGAAGTVTVTDAAQAANAIKVDGGTDVTITASGNTGGTIEVGKETVSPILPTGAVKVSSTGVLTDAGAAGADDVTMGTITIDGGSTVTVTQSAGITDAQKTAALTLATNDTVNQGAVTVNGGAATTSVTVVQDAAVTAAQYVASPKADGKIGVAAGAVTINDKNAASATLANTIATVSVTNATTVAVDSAALATLNLAGTITSVNTASTGSTGSATLALNTTGANTTGTIALDADTKTVNVTNSGTSTVGDLTAGGATALTVAGSGNLSFTASTLIGQAGLTSVNVTNTGSTNFGTTVLNTAATFTAAGGSETVTIGTATKAISMGDGNDEVILDSTTNISLIAASIDGGAGSADRITFETFAHAVTATATNVFEGKISGFEELKLAGANGAGAVVIDLGNLDDISKVILSATNTQDFSLDNMANNGTLRIEASQTNNEDITVIVKNAVLSTTDVMNIELSSATALANVDVTVANVETINVKTEDTDTTVVGNIAHALDLDAQAATKIVVTGNAGVDFTDSVFSTDLTSFDASAVTAGAVTYTSGALTKASTVKGGAGNDVINMAAALAAVTLSGNAGNDTLTGGKVADTINGGDGNDIIYGNEGADKLTGGEGRDIFAVTTVTDSNGVNVDTVTDFVSGTDFLSAGNKAITYLGEASSYGTVLTAFTGTGAAAPEAVLDTSTKTLYIDVDGNKILNNLDIAIDLNVSSLSQTDFAVLGTAAGEAIATSVKADTIYGLGGNDTVTLTANTTTLAAVSTDGKSISTAGMDIIMDFNAGDIVVFDTENSDYATTDLIQVAAGTSISKAITAGTIVEFSGLYDYVTGTFTSSATLAKDTASTTDVAATMYMYATTDAGTIANQGLILVGVSSQLDAALASASTLTIA